MARSSRPLPVRIATLCRTIAVMLISGVWRWRSFEEVDRAVRERSGREQALITGGVLVLLFGLSLAAAQFGWIGLLVFWMAVILIAN